MTHTTSLQTGQMAPPQFDLDARFQELLPGLLQTYPGQWVLIRPLGEPKHSPVRAELEALVTDNDGLWLIRRIEAQTP